MNEFSYSKCCSYIQLWCQRWHLLRLVPASRFQFRNKNYAINNIARISPSQEVMLISYSDEIYFGSDSPAIASVGTCWVSCLHRASIWQKGLIQFTWIIEVIYSWIGEFIHSWIGEVMCGKLYSMSGLSPGQRLLLLLRLVPASRFQFTMPLIILLCHK